METFGKTQGNALIKAGKKIGGAACLVGAAGCAYKAMEEKSAGWAAAGIFFGVVGLALTSS